MCAPSCVARHVQDKQEYAEVTSGNGAVLINEQQEKHGREFLEKLQVLMESHQKSVHYAHYTADVGLKHDIESPYTFS